MIKMRTAISGFAAAAAIATLFTAAPASAASDKGCTWNAICMDTWRSDNGTWGGHGHVERPNIYGHVHVTGPGGVDQNSQDKYFPELYVGSVGSGRVCAEFWELRAPGQYSLFDTACEDV